MNKVKLKVLIKYIILIFVLTIALILIGLIISKLKGFNLKDVLFIEGMIITIIGTFSMISGDSMGLSMQSLGQNNSQYSSNANLEVTKRLRENKTNNKITPVIKKDFNSICVIISGLICIAINFFI